MGKLNVGDKAPDFTLQDQDENDVSLSDFKGKRILVYFYPKADTPGCTKQAECVRDVRSELKQLNVQPIGISPDKPEKQKKFDDKYGLGFPLLSDPDHAVAEQYGVWGEKSRGGKTKMGIIRSLFVIDERGEVIESVYGVKPADTVPKAKEALVE